MKRFKVILIIAIALPICGYFLIPKRSITDRINNGDLQYSEELGWINWGHANPKETAKAFQRLQDQNKQSIDSFMICYSQSMRLKIMDYNMVFESKECRMVKPNLSPAEEKAVFFDLFVSVSENFEEMQGEFPHGLLQNSSFRDGDLAGDLFSYYRAISNTPLTEIKQNLTLYDSTESLKKYRSKDIGKNKNWNVVNPNCNSSNQVIKDIQKLILNETQREINQLSTTVSVNQNIYFENINSTN